MVFVGIATLFLVAKVSNKAATPLVVGRKISCLDDLYSIWEVREFQTGIKPTHLHLLSRVFFVIIRGVRS